MVKKRKKNVRYLHLIDNRPASFVVADGQICFSSENNPVRLRKTVGEIEKDQAITIKNRTKWGCDTDGYSYIKVFI